MVIEMESKKTLLELYFHKYLLYKNTTIIFLFTYLVAILIPFLTGQLNLRSFNDMILLLIISSVFITFLTIFIMEFNYHLKKIPIEIMKNADKI